MCIKPIYITNRSRRFRVGVDSPTQKVPCGHCKQCEQRKRDDWFVRGIAEYKRVLSKGGYVWFPTLTYRNSDLPIWHDSEFGFTAPVFDKSHFVSFRCKLRIYLKRAGYDLKGDKTLRYIYSTEYGDKKGRSHIHALIYVPIDVPYRVMHDCVKRAWIYGIVGYSKLGRVVIGARGIRYAMKYLHKDMLWFDKYGGTDYINKLKDKISMSSGDVKFKYMKRLSAFRKHLPHHCQSMGFGSYISLTDEQIANDSISAQDLGVSDLEFFYHIPLYYKRKLFYNFSKQDKIFTINDFGIENAKRNYYKRIDLLDKYFSSYIYTNIVDSFISSDLLKVSDLATNPRLPYFHELYRYDSKDIALYALVYRGVAIDKNLGSFLKLHSLPKDIFLDKMRRFGYYIYLNRVDNRDFPLVDDYRNNGARESSKIIGFSQCNVFSVFEYGIQFIESFEQILGDSRNKAYNLDYKKMREQFNMFNLIY